MEILDAFRDENGHAIIGEAWFIGTKFIDGVDFTEYLFDGPAFFHAAEFEEEASFSHAHFREGAYFMGASFNEVVNFESVTFEEDAEFRKASFESVAYFTGTQFKGIASFASCSFGDPEHHTGALFVMSCFHSLSNFDGARFLGTALFTHTEFKGHASFRYTAFGLQAIISETTFPDTSEFGPIFALETFVISDVVFPEAVTLEVDAANLACSRVKFSQGAALRVRRAEILLDHSVFSAPSTVSSVENFTINQPLRFSEDKELDATLAPQREEFAAIETAFEEFHVSLRGADTRAVLVSLREVDVSNLALVDLNLSECIFTGAHNLEEISIEGNALFSESPAGVHVKLSWPPFRRWTSRQVLAEERWFRSSHAASHEGGASGLVQRNEWQERSYESPKWVEYFGGAEPFKRTEPARLISTYRSLRKAFEDRKNEPGAADFYYGEMEMRRISSETPWAERVILTLYWLVSGYGLRAVRTLTWLALVTALVAAMLHFGKMADPELSYWGSLIYSIGQGIALPDPKVDLTAAGKALRVFMRLVTPLLLGLTILSVRNRVKR